MDKQIQQAVGQMNAGAFRSALLQILENIHYSDDRIEELKIIMEQPCDYHSMQSVIDILSSMSHIEKYHQFTELLKQILTI